MSRLTSSGQRLTLLAAAVTVIFWASAFPAIRVGLQAFSPFQVALLRYIAASIVLAIYALVMHLAASERAQALQSLSPGMLPPMGILCALIVVAAFMIALYRVPGSTRSSPWWGTRRRSLRVGLAVPMSSRRYT